MKLLIVRHAIAMNRDEYQMTAAGEIGHEDATVKSDELRPLTDDGLRKMRKNAKGITRLVDRPDALISSPLTRALQTAEILRDTWEGLEIVHSDTLRPERRPSDFLRWLRSRPAGAKGLNDQLVAIVGHEPHLSTLASWFLTGHAHSILEIKKGGALLLQFDGEVAKGAAELAWLATPSLLRGAR